MEKKEVKATITLDGQTHEIMISRERAMQIKRLQKLIKENSRKKETPPHKAGKAVFRLQSSANNHAKPSQPTFISVYFSDE